MDGSLYEGKQFGIIEGEYVLEGQRGPSTKLVHELCEELWIGFERNEVFVVYSGHENS